MGRAIGALACAALAACGTAASAAHETATPTPPEAAPRSAFVVASIDGGAILLRDDHDLYWVDPSGIRRRPLGGPDAGHAERLTADTVTWGDVTACDVHAGTVVLSDGDAIYALRPGTHVPVELARGVGPVVDLAVGADDVAFARADAIGRVALDGGAVQTLATGQTDVAGIAVDADHVYWTDYGEPRLSPPPLPDDSVVGMGTIRRVALRGGAIETIAGGRHGPVGIAVRDDRVWWADELGPALESARTTGGDVRTELAGAADLLAVDDAGAVVHTTSGFLVERPAGASTARLRLVADGMTTPLGLVPAIDHDWIYAVVGRADGTTAIVATPRDDHAPEVVVPVGGAVTRLRVHDGDLYWLETKRDGTGYDAWRGEPADGARHRLTDHYGWPTDLAVASPSEAYLAEDQSIYRIGGAGGALQPFAQASSYITGLTVHGGHVMWLDGAALMAQPRRSGEAFVVARVANGYGGGDTGSDVVFDDDYAYVTNFSGAVPGVYRISEHGQITLLWDGTQAYPGRDLVEVGGSLYFWAQSSQVYRLDPDGTATPVFRARGTYGDGYIADLVEASGLLYVSASNGGYWELTRIDPESDDTRVVLRWSAASDTGALAADDAGVYVELDQLGAIVRIPHTAAPVPDWSYPLTP